MNDHLQRIIKLYDKTKNLNVIAQNLSYCNYYSVQNFLIKINDLHSLITLMLINKQHRYSPDRSLAWLIIQLYESKAEGYDKPQYISKLVEAYSTCNKYSNALELAVKLPGNRWATFTNLLLNCSADDFKKLIPPEKSLVVRKKTKCTINVDTLLDLLKK